MNRKSIIKVLPKSLRICNDNCTKVQFSCYDYVYKEKVLLSITKGAKLFSKIWNYAGNLNLKLKPLPDLILIVSYNYENRNRVQELDSEESQELIEKYVELFI